MNRDVYSVSTIRKVFQRIGFSEWKGTDSVMILNHTSFNQELVLDIDQDVIPWSRIKPDLEDMKLRTEFFDHLYNNEI
jgi:hypothetical protein